MLPPPTLSFTIPSVHDNIELSCRVYHPLCLSPSMLSQVGDWNKKVAIIAHPYAPLGGSYDDPVVDLIASTILKAGFCVGTFNFRGAGQSQAHTSWRSVAEHNDYISFIGFMAYYVHLLVPPHADLSPIEPPKFTHSNIEPHNLTPVPSQSLPPPHLDGAISPNTSSHAKVASTQPLLLLGGYSYGAMVTSCLPAILSSILEPFQAPVAGSAHAEIRMRAESLARQQNETISAHLSALFMAQHRRGRSLKTNDLLSSPTARRTSGGMRAGGTESMRRESHDSYRSRSSFTIETHERVRKSVDRVRSYARHRPRKTASDESLELPYKSSDLKDSNYSLGKVSNTSVVLSRDSIGPVSGVADSFRTAYLLVSPLQGFVGGLLTLWSFKPSKDLPDPEFKFGVNPSLALFADDDSFVAAKKLRSWAHNLQKDGKGNFRYREIKGAGHFWHDRECQIILKEEVRTFVRSL